MRTQMVIASQILGRDGFARFPGVFSAQKRSECQGYKGVAQFDGGHCSTISGQLSNTWAKQPPPCSNR